MSAEYQSLIDHVKAGTVLSIIAKLLHSVQCLTCHTSSDGGHHCDYVTVTRNDCDVLCPLSHECVPSLPTQHNDIYCNSNLLLTRVILTVESSTWHQFLMPAD